MSEICDEIKSKISLLKTARDRVSVSSSSNTSTGARLIGDIDDLTDRMNRLRPNKMSTPEIANITDEANELLLRASSPVYARS
jgi:hypothetical protein